MPRAGEGGREPEDGAVARSRNCKDKRYPHALYYATPGGADEHRRPNREQESSSPSSEKRIDLAHHHPTGASKEPSQQATRAPTKPRTHTKPRLGATPSQDVAASRRGHIATPTNSRERTVPAVREPTPGTNAPHGIQPRHQQPPPPSATVVAPHPLRRTKDEARTCHPPTKRQHISK